MEEECEWCGELVSTDVIVIVPYGNKEPFKVCIDCVNKVDADE